MLEVIQEISQQTLQQFIVLELMNKRWEDLRRQLFREIKAGFEFEEGPLAANLLIFPLLDILSL